MPDNDVREALLKAHNEMTKRGWLQGAMYSHEANHITHKDMLSGKVCAVGAINAAICLPFELAGWDGSDEAAENAAVELEGKARNHLARYLRATYRYDVLPTIPEWNDADGRTAEDVLLALKSAAEWDADE